MGTEKTFEVYVPVAKLDEEQRIVFGWASVIEVDGQPVIDQQNDVIPEEELEKAVYEFMVVSRAHDEMHKRVVEGSHFVESFVVTDEKLSKMFGDKAPQSGFRGWWVGIKITDEEVWKKHKDGTYTGFSITGSAVREGVSA